MKPSLLSRDHRSLGTGQAGSPVFSVWFVRSTEVFSGTFSASALFHNKNSQPSAHRKRSLFSVWLQDPFCAFFPKSELHSQRLAVSPPKARLPFQEGRAGAAFRVQGLPRFPQVPTGTVMGSPLEPTSPTGRHRRHGGPWCFSSPCAWGSRTSTRPTWGR